MLQRRPKCRSLIRLARLIRMLGNPEHSRTAGRDPFQFDLTTGTRIEMSDDLALDRFRQGTVEQAAQHIVVRAGLGHGAPLNSLTSSRRRARTLLFAT